MLASFSHTLSSATTSKDRERDWLPLRDVVNEFSIHPNTARKYADSGKINVLRLASGKRLWSRKSLLSFLGSPQPESVTNDSGLMQEKSTIPLCCCIRVSSFAQSKPSSSTVDKSSLQHQEERIRSYISERFKGQNVSLHWYKRISSGMVFDNPCFLTMIEDILQGKFSGGYLIASDFTRVARFGIKLIEHLCNLGNCKILFTLNDSEANEKGIAESLTDEVLSILTHYTAKASGAKAALIQSVKVEPETLKKVLTLHHHNHSFPEIARQLNKEGLKGIGGRELTAAVCRGLVKRNKSLIPSLTGNGTDSLSPAFKHSFTDFCQQKLRVTGHEEAFISLPAIVEAYRTWCFRQGLLPLTSSTTFKAVLKVLFPKCLARVGLSGKRQYHGLVIVREKAEIEATEVIEVEEVRTNEAIKKPGIWRAIRVAVGRKVLGHKTLRHGT